MDTDKDQWVPVQCCWIPIDGFKEDSEWQKHKSVPLLFRALNWSLRLYEYCIGGGCVFVFIALCTIIIDHKYYCQKGQQ